MNICLYGASSTELDARYLDAAYDLGRRIAAGGHTMVYGGGAQGVMGAAARGVVDGGVVVGKVQIQIGGVELLVDLLVEQLRYISVHDASPP